MLHLSQTYPQRRAFVTGAASGLGKAFCMALAADGWTLGMADFDREGLQHAAQAVEEAGGKALPFFLDVSDRSDYQQVAEHFLSETDGIDLLINNAGVGDGGAFHRYSLDHWDWMVGINQMGVVHGCFFFVPVFRRQKSGHIINISSAAAYANGPNMSAYNATKAAVRSLSETLRYELFPHKVKVSVVMPTFFKTNILKHARGGEAAVNFAKKMLERSSLQVDEVAGEILAKAGKGKFNIILPRRARMGYLLKRLLPGYFARQMENTMKKQVAKGVGRDPVKS